MKNIFQKLSKKNLLDSKECIEERIRLINHFDKSIPGLLNTTIDKKGIGIFTVRNIASQ